MKYYHPFENEIYANKDSKFLILGTFPSKQSKEFGYFYGNKNNVFWRLLGDIFAKNIQEKEKLTNANKQYKKEFCKRYKIVLFDIVQSYEGDFWCSNDTDLFRQKNIKYSIEQIYKIICKNPQIKIFGTSHKVVSKYNKHIISTLKESTKNTKYSYQIKYLPSPSPLNFQKYEDKLRIWRESMTM